MTDGKTYAPLFRGWGALFCLSLRSTDKYDRIKRKKKRKEGFWKMKRIVITVVFVIAAVLAAAGIFSNFDIERPVEQFPAIGQVAGRTN